MDNKSHIFFHIPIELTRQVNCGAIWTRANTRTAMTSAPPHTSATKTADSANGLIRPVQLRLSRRGFVRTGDPSEIMNGKLN